MILPQLDHAPLYNQMTFVGHSRYAFMSRHMNPILRTGSPDVFHCPSEPGPHLKNITALSSSIRDELGRDVICPTINYAGNCGLNLEDEEKGSTGAFGVNSSIAFKNFIDGTSNTIMFSENRVGTSNDTRGNFASNGPSNASFHFTQTPNSQQPDTFQSTRTCPSSNDPRQPCVIVAKSTPLVNWYGGARSVHTGGVITALVDGSVRFVSDNIDMSTWRALGTRAGS